VQRTPSNSREPLAFVAGVGVFFARVAVFLAGGLLLRDTGASRRFGFAKAQNSPRLGIGYRISPR
jgi:hypothetical protein